MSCKSIVERTNELINHLTNTSLNDEQKEILNQYKVYIDLWNKEFKTKSKNSIKKYHKSEKGKIKNNQAQRKYYLKNKERILQKKKEKYKQRQLELKRQRELENN